MSVIIRAVVEVLISHSVLAAVSQIETNKTSRLVCNKSPAAPHLGKVAASGTSLA